MGIHISFVSCHYILCLFLYWNSYLFCIVGVFIYIRDYIPNVFLLHRDFQSYLFFVLHKYLIFMWLSLPGFSFITLVFYVMHREATFSLHNKNIHFALVFVSFHFLHFMLFSLRIYLCVKSEVWLQPLLFSKWLISYPSKIWLFDLSPSEDPWGNKGK